MPSSESLAPRTIPIERRAGFTPAAFEVECLSGAGTPVIVTDAMDGWRAKTAWSFDFFRTTCGTQPVAVPVRGGGDPLVRLMSLAEYLDVLERRPARVPGVCVDTSTGLPASDPPDLPDAPLYLAGRWNAFLTHPHLLDDIDRSPRFVDDWLALLPPAFRQLLQATDFSPYWLLIGPRGSVTRLHRDFLHSHAYLAQVAGRKRCLLFSPDDSASLYEGAVDPEHPDLDRHPRFADATTFECVIEPGELLFVPPRWWHHVIGLDNTITVSYNFFTRSNFGDYWMDLLRALPGLLESFDRMSPGWRQVLDIPWTSRGFDS